MIPIRSFAVCVLAFGVTACSESIAPTDFIIDVEITVSAPTVNAATPVTIVVTATNRGAEPVRVDESDCPTVFHVFEVTGEQIVGPALLPCTSFASYQPLQAGESLEFIYMWDGEGSGPVSGTGEPLPPGLYRVQGYVRVHVPHMVPDLDAAHSELTPVEILSLP